MIAMFVVWVMWLHWWLQEFQGSPSKICRICLCAYTHRFAKISGLVEAWPLYCHVFSHISSRGQMEYVQAEQHVKQTDRRFNGLIFWHLLHRCFRVVRKSSTSLKRTKENRFVSHNRRRSLFLWSFQVAASFFTIRNSATGTTESFNLRNNSVKME